MTTNTEIIDAYRAEMRKRVIGQDDLIDTLLLAFIAGGHALLEGVPGLAKTRAVKTFARVTGLAFKRIQFTPDLLPADLTGTLVWEPEKERDFVFRPGPVFANIVLADEINRAPAKVQSALLEAMEEHQVTAGDVTHPLPEPFFVLATQNPIEHEGTYALPEAELDRFLVKLRIPYPKTDEEIAILDKTDEKTDIAPLLTPEIMKNLRTSAENVHVDEKIKRYIVSIVRATRSNPDGADKKGASFYRYINFGASPRGSLALYTCSKIRALLQGRDFVQPEDVKKSAPAVLRHRLSLSYEAEADFQDADTLVSRILNLVPVP